jgi:hypothetical protein
MTMTLNQIIQRLSDIVGAHKQVRTFAYVNSAVNYVQSAGKKVDYPIVIAEHNTGAISSTQHLSTHNFRFYVLDLVSRVGNADENEQEVLSDMFGVAEDLIALFRDPAYFGTWFIGSESPVSFLVDQTVDYLAGVAFSLDISSFFLSDRCNVPATALPADTIEIITTKADWTWVQFTMQTNSNTFTLASLINKEILGIWRDTQPQKQVASNPADQLEYTFDSTTGTLTWSPDNILFTGTVITIICK